MFKKNIPPFLFLMVLFCSTSALADTATLIRPPANQPLAPNGTMAFTLSSDIPQDKLANIFVEFDGYDVTDMVSMDGLTVSFQSPSRLSAGDYHLRLLEKSSTGKMDQLEDWTIRVGGDGLKDSSVEGTLDTQYAYLAADNLHGAAAEQPHQLTANLNTVAKTGGKGWDASVTANAFYDSDPRRNANGRNALLGEYLLTGRTFSDTVNTSWRLGNHDTGVSNLLMDRFYRRGVSGEANFASRADVIAFSQDPAATIGQEDALGFNDDDQRASGIFGKIYPFDDQQRIFFETGYYTGIGTMNGSTSSAPDLTHSSGNGWLLAAEGQTPDDKANLRGDYAFTRFDEDGRASLVSAKSDNAERLRLTYALRGDLKTFDSEQSQWTITALQQRTGTYFRTLLNSTLPQDENRFDLSSNYQKGTVNIFGQTYYTTNNVDDIAGMPTDGTFGLNGQISFSATDAFGSTLHAPDWFKNSTLTFGGSLIDQNRTQTPAGFMGTDLAQYTWTANGGWTATFANATLSLQNVYSSFRDKITGANSYTDDLSSISGTYAVNDRVSLAPQVQFEALDNHSTGSSSKYFAGIDTTAILIPDKLTHTFHYSTLIDSSVAGMDQRNASTTLTWQIKQPAQNDPGISLALSGFYQDNRDVPNIIPPATASASAPVNGEDFKVYLQLKISTPFGL